MRTRIRRLWRHNPGPAIEIAQRIGLPREPTKRRSTAQRSEALDGPYDIRSDSVDAYIGAGVVVLYMAASAFTRLPFPALSTQPIHP
jgi:hypothetical protein